MEWGAESDAIIDKRNNVLQPYHQGSFIAISECHVYMRPHMDISSHVCVTVLPPEAKKCPKIERVAKPLRSSILFSNHYKNVLLGVAMVTVFEVDLST